MLKTMKGSPNGIEVKEYVAGEKYTLPDSLGNAFLQIKVAELHEEPKAEPTKASPTQNKATAPKANKRR